MPTHMLLVLRTDTEGRNIKQAKAVTSNRALGHSQQLRDHTCAPQDSPYSKVGMDHYLTRSFLLTFQPVNTNAQ